MTQDEFNRILREKKTREEAIASSLANVPDQEIEHLLREYISCKYLLPVEEMTDDDLIRLGEKSTAYIAGILKQGIEFREKSAGCTTASSGVIKKSLLAIRLGQLIGKKLDPDAIAMTETVPQLAELIIRTRNEA